MGASDGLCFGSERFSSLFAGLYMGEWAFLSLHSLRSSRLHPRFNKFTRIFWLFVASFNGTQRGIVFGTVHHVVFMGLILNGRDTLFDYIHVPTSF